MPNRQPFLLSIFGSASIFTAVNLTLVHAAPFMIIGNDEKLAFDADAKPILSPPGKDSVVILDLADPENPKTVANLPLKNSVVGPPVNVAIDPTNSVALVADSVDVVKDGDNLKIAPDNKVYVIDLKANPPKLAGTVTVGKQPSGLSFSPSGDLALVANRADKTISVLGIKGTDVKVLDTIDMGDIVAHVTFTWTASTRSRPNSTITKSRCSTSTATRSPTTNSTCRPASGPTMWRWRRTARSRSARTTAMLAAPTAVSIR
jgi:hypothetical protein